MAMVFGRCAKIADTTGPSLLNKELRELRIGQLSLALQRGSQRIRLGSLETRASWGALQARQANAEPSLKFSFALFNLHLQFDNGHLR
jgi:hypothetical protein